ncbi:MAG TPA: hypothetical protein VGC13_23855 [Longimicrobium sp.]|jgi:hypothetical protein|uniref:hypothetical protein n=1 Tax=Longimicrobium sp. TaxID=2029185 RepID=UPI002EDB4DFC
MKNRILVLLLLLAAAACAPSPGGAGGVHPRRSDRLTFEEIQAVGVTNMYDVVQRLQPGWLRQPQAVVGRSLIGVFMDGTRMGEVEFLRQISPSMVGSARYLTGGQIGVELTELQQVGLGGAIMLTSGRNRRP